MLWFRKRNSAVSIPVLSSAIYLLYIITFRAPPADRDSPVANRGQIGRTRRNSGGVGMKEDFVLGGKSRMQWDNQVPRTRVVQEYPGFVVFDNLYAHQGRYTAVSNDKRVRSVAQSAISGKEPQFRLLDGFHAVLELGDSGIVVPGTTIIFNDPPGPDGYMIYPSNFIGEAVLGAWKALATSPTTTALRERKMMSPDAKEDGEAGVVALPSRYIFPKCGQAGTWQDTEGQNAWFLTHLSPFAAIEEEGSWNARSQSGEVFLFERAVIVDRMAAHAARGDIDEIGKMSAAIAKSPTTGQDIMAPLRASFFESLEVAVQIPDKPIVVYMDHQSEGRRLIKSQHEQLIQALRGLVDIAEIHVVSVQKMIPTERLELFGRATIMLSVFHDDSLHQVFMPPKNRTTVIEICDPGSYAPDWHLVANMVGHRYYPIHYDQIALQRPRQRVDTSGMDGDKLIVDTLMVTDLIRKILTEPDAEKLAKFIDEITDIDEQ